MLEISAGAIPVHTLKYAELAKDVEFQPCEADEYMTSEIDRHAAGNANVRRARVLDLTNEHDWDALEGERYNLAYGTNFLHMWVATGLCMLIALTVLVPGSHCAFPTTADGEVLTAGVSPTAVDLMLRRLRRLSSVLILYGPFKTDEGFKSEADAKVRAPTHPAPP